jgi:hypothetical protein
MDHFNWDFEDEARVFGDGAVTVALAVASTPPAEGVTLSDFYAHMPSHTYIWAPTGQPWPAVSVNARIPSVEGEDGKAMAAAAWLDRHRPVEQMTWAPGEPQFIKGRIVSDGGWIERAGCACFNLYRPPLVKPGVPEKAQPWVSHVRRVYPYEADHIIAWLAHRVQRPHEKINHAIVLGGNQGIGKDSILEPVKHGVGPWNFAEVSPQHMLGRFNGFVKSVILRVSEARDLGDIDRFAFYDHMKTYTAAPPDVIRVDEKHRQEYAVFNVCGVIITSNHKSDGIYLPADDRRHYVAWSDLTKDDFDEAYWNNLWSWYAAGGQNDVAAYLRTLDLRHFNAKAPPPKTEAFWAIADSNRAPEDAEMADAIEKLGTPKALTINSVKSCAAEEFRAFLSDRKNSRRIPFRLEECGYEPVRNPAVKDGYWKLPKQRVAIYARRELGIRDRIKAAEELVASEWTRWR